MDRLYEAGERMAFGRGTVMAADHAARFAYGLVELDRESGKYRRVNRDVDRKR
ncbi:MAG: hypothetical protein J0J01_08980 [Reyranella sp.]|uniref:hypothetical protein n=1 Tax=Reyranella sp. TaxID=1929291 RepID=UPI001AD54A16|nr:hypothetical protein [Reyranella sp.]MBN9087027.1 hypothetical protein [Reyranella sp.]